MGEEDKLTTKAKAVYGAGYLGVSLSTFAITTWLATYYLPPEGGKTIIPDMVFFGKAVAAAYLFGLAQSVGRFLNAIADPLIGYLSDNTRSRLGRRRPYILIGTPVLVILFLLVFRPTFPAGNPGNFYHLLITINLFYLFYAIVITPYLSLLPEIARSTAERIRLSGWQTIFNVAGVACAVILGDIVRHYFGYWVMSLFFAALIFAAFFLPGIRIKERTVVKEGQRIGFWRALAITLENKPFIIFLLGQTLVWFGFSLIQGALRHVVVALMGLQTVGMAKCLFLSLTVAVICMPLVFKLTHKYGKKRAYIIMVSTFVPLLAAIYLLRSPWVGNFTTPLGYIIFALMGIPISAFFIIPNSILGEIIDYDEKHTGLRREAIYFSTQSLINKTGLAISSILMGILLSIGYTVDNPMGIRLLGPTAAAFVLCGMIVFSFYPLEDAAFRRTHGRNRTKGEV